MCGDREVSCSETERLEPTSRNTPSCQTYWEEIFFGRKKREDKEEIFEKLLLNFEIFFWNKDKFIEEIFEENVSIV